MIGYACNQKGYKLYDLNKRVIFVSRNVIFEEAIYPLKDNDSNSNHQGTRLQISLEEETLEHNTIQNSIENTINHDNVILQQPESIL